jgi:branched-chain amino acid transport system substrate-binding protein
VIKVYEEVYTYAEALKQVKDATDHTAISEAIRKQTRDTANGPLEFDPSTHLAKSGPEHFPIQYYQYQDEKVVTVSPESVAEGKFMRPPWME